MVSNSDLIQIKRRQKLERLSIPSQLFHFLYFALKPKMQFDCGVILTSIDVDVGSKIIDEINHGKNDANIHEYLTERRVGEIEEEVIPRLIRFFDELEIPVTFAVRGQLTETRSEVLELLVRSIIRHDIGAHGYYHRTFTSLTKTEAQNELGLISTGMNKFHIKPRSFVFPKNKVGHLSLLERFGYVCYRDEGGLLKDGMYVKKTGQLYDIHPSFHLGATYNPIFLDKIINIAAKYRVPFHLWFHPRDLYEARGSVQRTIDRVLSPVYSYAKKEEKKGTIRFETMYSLAEKISKKLL